MTIPLDQLIGLPYALGGRLPGPGIDCFGVVLACCAHIGREVPDPFRAADEQLDVKAWILQRLQGWRLTARPSRGAVVEFRNPRYPAHVGFMLSEREFIHATRNTGVIVSRLDRAPWHDRIVGFYVYCN